MLLPLSREELHRLDAHGRATNYFSRDARHRPYYIEAALRAHQVPLEALAEMSAHIQILEDWMKIYRPEDLFDDLGSPVPEVRAAAPEGLRRMGMNPKLGACWRSGLRDWVTQQLGFLANLQVLTIHAGEEREIARQGCELLRAAVT